MTKKAKVKEDFIDDSPAIKIDKSYIKYQKMKENNDTFPSPDKDLEEFKSDIEKLEEYYKAVEAGDHSKIAARDAAEAVVNNDLRILANYVSRIANGSEAIIVLAGFTPTKTEITKSQIPAQAVLQGSPGKVIGALELKVAKVEFAIRYTFIVAQNLSGVSMSNGTVTVSANSQVISIKTTNLNKVTFTDLETRTNYSCICFATSTVGSGIFSEAITVKSF
jgi:hypothetical protein